MAMTLLRMKVEDARVHISNPFSHPHSGARICGGTYTVKSVTDLNGWRDEAELVEGPPTCLLCIAGWERRLA